MKLNGAAILIECLIEQGVGTVFGFPGGAVLPIYDELYKRQGRIEHVLTAHEQHAGHAADGYARRQRPHGGVHRHQRPRRDQPGDPHCHGVYGLLPCGLYHGKRASEPDGHGFLSGGGYLRHDHAGDQAQLSRHTGG